MLKTTRLVLTFAIAGVCFTASDAQRNPTTPPKPEVLSDTTKPKPASPAKPAKPGPKAFKDVVGSKATAQKGMFNIYESDGKYFFEIPYNMMGRDILTVTRISKSGAGFRTGGSGYAGDDVNQTVIRFETGPNDNVFIKSINVLEKSVDSSGGMYWNVENSNLQPIAAAFDIKAYAKDSATGVVIDMTDFLSGDNDIFFFDARAKRGFGLSSQQKDRSYTQGIKTFAGNVEIRTVKTYTRSAPTIGPGGPSGNGEPATIELNTSLVLLPENPLQPRLFDDRVGYFTSQAITDFDLNPQGVKTIRYIKRFRLEPKPEDMERYKRGEMVEPIKPIVYYIDPTTPKKWVPYLIMGVNDWSIAFEKAGFKNAIIAKEAPTREQDSTWSLEDARHNAIVYKPSPIANASGPSIIDPRSGEIMETHINWYHNVMSLLRNWYMVQAAAVDPSSRKMVFDDELMGQLIRFVSSHEVGHTLGLRHNFGSSSTVPVEKLRDKAFLEANGHTPSIMDYARFNYVAQPEDNISQKGLFPRIGDYDKWAIEWGYRLFPDYKTPEAELGMLNTWTINNLKNARLFWGDGESNRDDPRNQTEDLGDNSMKASSYGLKNLQRILPKLPEYTKTEDEDFGGLSEMYSQIIGQFGRYIGHVSSNIGGIERTPKRQEQLGPVYQFTGKARQKEAMDWLQSNLFKTPTWVFQKTIYELTTAEPLSTVSGLQNRALASLISASTVNNLLKAEADLGKNAYTVTEMMDDLRNGIFSELKTKAPIDVYRRQLQKSFTERVISILQPPANSLPQLPIQFRGSGISSTGDGLSIAKAQLRGLQNSIRIAMPVITDAASKNHLMDLQDRIKMALEPK